MEALESLEEKGPTSNPISKKPLIPEEKRKRNAGKKEKKKKKKREREIGSMIPSMFLQ